MTWFARRVPWLAILITVLAAKAAGAAPSGPCASTVSSSRIAAILLRASTWVFVVDARGTALDHFDDVATEFDLQNAVNRQIQ